MSLPIDSEILQSLTNVEEESNIDETATKLLQSREEAFKNDCIGNSASRPYS
jgi:hypothetical protein